MKLNRAKHSVKCMKLLVLWFSSVKLKGFTKALQVAAYIVREADEDARCRVEFRFCPVFHLCVSK